MQKDIIQQINAHSSGKFITKCYKKPLPVKNFILDLDFFFFFSSVAPGSESIRTGQNTRSETLMVFKTCSSKH